MTGRMRGAGLLWVLAIALAGCQAGRHAEPLPPISIHDVLGDRPIDTDVTDRVELLGEPFKARWFGKAVYARNIWDMQVYDGRVYLGCGNSSNEGPAPNAGPVPVVCYDPYWNRFSYEATLAEEQIDRYCLIDGQLYIPGHDPKWQSWDLGNYYVRGRHRWQKRRVLPDTIHCYDLHKFDGGLFAVVGSGEGATVIVSRDGGNTWQPGSEPRENRACTFLELAGRLYVCNSLSGVSEGGATAGTCGIATVYEYVDGTWRRAARLSQLMPDAGLEDTIEENAMVRRPVRFGPATLYLGTTTTNDHQWVPFGLYAATSVDDARRVDVPGLPYDVLVRGDTCFVLSCTPPVDTADPRWTIAVYASRDLAEWHEVLHFHAATFARSFENLDGDFYFGLGCDADRVAAETGRVLRLRRVFTKALPATTAPASRVAAPMTSSG